MLNLTIVGMDTSHAVEFTRRFQAPDCPPELRVAGATVTHSVRFETPFQDGAGLDARQKQLEAWGVDVTEDLDGAIASADALLLTVNDPARHVEYVTRCAGRGVPIYLDKPIAQDLDHGRHIGDLVRAAKLPFVSSSSLRFTPELGEARAAIPAPRQATMHGAFGHAAAGSSIVWYGVHVVEMLVSAMGHGATVAHAHPVGEDVVLVVEYEGGRTGVAELNAAGGYGGVLRRGTQASSFTIASDYYSALLRELMPFLAGGEEPVPIEEALRVIAILDAAERSAADGGAPVAIEATS